MLATRRLYNYLLFVVISFVFCGCSGDVDKAKDFISAGMSPQAIELLNKRIKEKPTDAEAQFQLGVCYINTGDFSNAKDRFASAVQLKSDYGYKIGPEYKKAGSQALAKGDMSRAIGLYRQAVQYQAGLKNDIGTELLAEGKTLFEKGQQKTAENYFMAAANINPDIKETIAAYYFQAGNKTDAPTDLKTTCLDTAVKFSQSNKYIEAQKKQNETIGEEYYTKAQAVKVPDGGIMLPAERQELINKLSQKVGFLSKSCQYTSRYRGEYEENLARLEIEKMILRTITIRGNPKITRVSAKGELISGGKYSKHFKVYYFSAHAFNIYFNRNEKYTWDQRTSEIGYKTFTSDSGKDTEIWFELATSPTDVYYWVEEL